jgi:tRNA A-37 threonylcarbamoyl transferase component Bud32
LPDRPFPPPDKTLTTPGPGGSSPSTSGSARGFPPGTVFAGRYQIVSPLGQGGMGIVYRAEDIKLGQPVALKFLPSELSSDQAMLHYLYAEVRNARQISHPNICRVYDIGEYEGRHFLSMEYVDGEDLASLLKRIGRLPAQKALEISREICAGLAAAHEQGVIHRDLKPANIMIDGRGQARIMDFGLAIKPFERTQAEDSAGTPAYMAPEQLAGMGTSVKSDIFSLGLVLYELFTGRKVLEGVSLEEIRRKQLTETPPPPSSYGLDIDPEIDRVITRCLARDPASRPGSVLEVAVALPGGDPLRAALAAGRTPTPEMVAAAGKEGSLGALAAWGLLGLFIAVLVIAVVLAPRSILLGTPGLKKSPDVLAERAREILGSIGYTESPKDSAYWFEADEDLIYWLQHNQSKTASRPQILELETRRVKFRYRQSPRRLVPSGNQGFIQENNPPFNVPGMIGVDLDSKGRLLRFMAIPASSSVIEESSAAPDWSAFLTAAGLEIGSLSPVSPKELPPLAFDHEQAWTGTLNQQTPVPIRVLSASLQGKPVFFEIQGPWIIRAAATNLQTRWTQIIFPSIWFTTVLVLWLFGIYLARRNIRMKRSDARGAFRISIFAFLTLASASALWAHHAYNSFGDFMWWIRGGMAFFLFDAIFIWIAYMAIEPAMRRRWAKLLISWSRLMSGRFRDPLVGRDILIGGIVGAITVVPVFIFRAFPAWMFLPGEWSAHIELNSLLGFPQQIGTVLYIIGLTAFYGVGWMIAMVFCHAVFRKTWLVAVVFTFFGTVTLLVGSSGDLTTQILSGCFYSGVFAGLLLLYGFLPAAISFFVYNILARMPLRLDIPGWSSRGSVLTLIVVVALILYGFYTSFGGRPIFGQIEHGE